MFGNDSLCIFFWRSYRGVNEKLRLLSPYLYCKLESMSVPVRMSAPWGPVVGNCFKGLAGTLKTVVMALHLSSTVCAQVTLFTFMLSSALSKCDFVCCAKASFSL